MEENGRGEFYELVAIEENTVDKSWLLMLWVQICKHGCSVHLKSCVYAHATFLSPGKSLVNV